MKKEGLSYSLALFKDLFLGLKKETTVLDFFEILIKKIKAKNQISNAAVYRAALNSIQKFQRISTQNARSQSAR